jgi:hypothetical protein
MTALPIEPTLPQLLAAIEDRGPHMDTEVTAFQLGIEAERARAKALAATPTDLEKLAAASDRLRRAGRQHLADPIDAVIVELTTHRSTPTTTQWALRLGTDLDDNPLLLGFDENDARRLRNAVTGHTLLRRTIGPWQETT